MFERQPEVLSGLEKAFKDYEQKNEKPSLIGAAPPELWPDPLGLEGSCRSVRDELAPSFI
jgi:hypothetical protein